MTPTATKTDVIDLHAADVVDSYLSMSRQWRAEGASEEEVGAKTWSTLAPMYTNEVIRRALLQLDNRRLLGGKAPRTSERLCAAWMRLHGA